MHKIKQILVAFIAIIVGGIISGIVLAIQVIPRLDSYMITNLVVNFSDLSTKYRDQQFRQLADSLADLGWMTIAVGAVFGLFWVTMTRTHIRIEDPLDVRKWRFWWIVLLVLAIVTAGVITYIELRNLPYLQPGRSFFLYIAYILSSMMVFWVISLFTRRTLISVVFLHQIRRLRLTAPGGLS